MDKLIIDRHSRNVYAYSAWIGIFELTLGLISFGIVAAVQGVSPASLFGGAAIGAVSAAGLMLYLAALRYGQVSRVVPIWFLYPLLVAPMAAVFLDEHLSGVVVAAIFLAVGGSVLVSWEGTSSQNRFGHPAALLLAFGAAIAWAFSFVLSKHYLEDGSFWQVFASYRLGFAPVMFVGIVNGRVRRAAVNLVN